MPVTPEQCKRERSCRHQMNSLLINYYLDHCALFKNIIFDYGNDIRYYFLLTSYHESFYIQIIYEQNDI